MNKHPTPPIIDAIFKIAIICAIIKILIYGFDLYSSYPPFINYVYMKAIIYFYKKLIRLIIIYSIEFFILPQLYEIIATLASLKKKKEAAYTGAGTSNFNPPNIRRCRETEFCRKITNFVTWIKRRTTQIYNNGNQK